MKYKINHFVAALFFVLSLNVSAEYKTTDFTQEEYQKVSETSGEYKNCLNETALSQIDKEKSNLNKGSALFLFFLDRLVWYLLIPQYFFALLQ